MSYICNWLTPEETISPSPMEAPPLGRILKLLCKDAITISNFSASTVDIENSKTKKQRSKFIRSLNVAIHAGAPAESEQMAEQVQDLVAQYGIQDQVEIDFNAEYVLLNLNGAVLFDSGKSEIKSEAYPLMDKIGKILQSYQQNMIEIEGHTDNVPFTHSSKYENNDVLSMYRALYVADYMRNITTIDPSHIKSSGRGEYVPIADNSTPEGRARNRRVEIKIYNSYYSEIN